MSSTNGSTPAWHTDVPLGLAASAEIAAEDVAAAVNGAPQTKLRKGYLVTLVVSYFALYIAWIAPIGFSLAIRVAQIDEAAKDTALAFAIGIPGLLVLVTGPLVGILSDRTRLRFGRRRSWLLGGMIVGLIGSLLVGLAPSIPLLIAAWSLAYVGYTAAGGMFMTHLGDRLPEEQRGKVAGFTGAVTQIAPILGVALAGGFVAMPFVMFAAPAILAFVIGLVFVVVMKDAPAPDARTPINMKAVLEGFWFDPRRHPNFGWVWISRCLIFTALSFMTLYTVYLLGARLNLDSATIAGLVAIQGILGIAVAVTGSIVSGTLSDRLRTRKPFIVLGAFLLAAGLLVTATLQSIPQFFIGGIISVLGVGIFAAIDQAIGLDVLPTDQQQNGRFMGIFNLANQLAQGVGPFLAGAILLVAGGDYSWVYFVAAAVAVIGGLLILPVRKDRPATVETSSTA